MEAYDGMKHFFHIAMMVHGFLTFPASLIFLIYSVGTLLLFGNWHYLLWGIGAFAASGIIFVALAIASE